MDSELFHRPEDSLMGDPEKEPVKNQETTEIPTKPEKLKRFDTIDTLNDALKKAEITPEHFDLELIRLEREGEKNKERLRQGLRRFLKTRRNEHPRPARTEQYISSELYGSKKFSGAHAEIETGIDQNGRFIAKKIFLEASEKSRARCQTELAVLVRLQKYVPRVAKFLTSGQEEDGRPYLIFELTPMQHVLDRDYLKGLSLKKRLLIAEKFFLIVGMLHQEGILHGDFSNLNLGESIVGLNIFDFSSSLLTDDPEFSNKQKNHQENLALSLSLSILQGQAQGRFLTHSMLRACLLDERRDREQAGYVASYLLSLHAPSEIPHGSGWDFLEKNTRKHLMDNLRVESLEVQRETWERFERVLALIKILTGPREKQFRSVESFLKALGTEEALKLLNEEQLEGINFIAPFQNAPRGQLLQLLMDGLKKAYYFLRPSKFPLPPLPLPLRGDGYYPDHIAYLRRLNLGKQYIQQLKMLEQRGIIPSVNNPKMFNTHEEKGVVPHFSEIWKLMTPHFLEKIMKEHPSHLVLGLDPLKLGPFLLK